MRSFVITKWIEPYRLLESIKEFYTYADYTFDGMNKEIQKSKFLKELEANANSVGLYMKNVNKFYLFKRAEDFDIISKLIEIFEFTQDDYFYTDNIDEPFALVDMAKAEAGIIF